jgi:hypothetical protein
VADFEEELRVVEVKGTKMPFFRPETAPAHGGVVVGSGDGQAGEAKFAVRVATTDTERQDTLCT